MLTLIQSDQFMQQDNTDLSSVPNMTQLSETRLWKVLDGMTERLGSIESGLKEVAALGERVNNHGDSLRRIGKKVDTIDDRQRDTDLALAPIAAFERLVKHMRSDADNFKDSHAKDMRQIDDDFNDLKKDLDQRLDDIKKAIGSLQTSESKVEGKTIVKEHIFKWIAGLFMLIIMYLITGVA